jgi:hypothetical protein
MHVTARVQSVSKKDNKGRIFMEKSLNRKEMCL